tara:strand:- start:73 stop:693 length:621 start_codon:yes stop_codon:yes gene_type:complete
LRYPKKFYWHFLKRREKKRTVEISPTIGVAVAVRENTTIGIAKIAPVASTTMKTMEHIQEARVLVKSVLLDIINLMKVVRLVMLWEQGHTKILAAVHQRGQHVALENTKIKQVRVRVNTVVLGNINYQMEQLRVCFAVQVNLRPMQGVCLVTIVSMASIFLYPAVQVVLLVTKANIKTNWVKPVVKHACKAISALKQVKMRVTRVQ